MRLPEDLEIKFDNEFNTRFGEKHMEFMTYREERGHKKGKLEGKIEGEVKALLLVLTKRFGDLPQRLQEAVARTEDVTKLDELLGLAATCLSLDEFERAVPQGN